MRVPVIGVTGPTGEWPIPPHVSVVSVRESYIRAVESGGGAPTIVVSLSDEDQLRAVFDRLDGLLLSGGGDVLPDLYGAQDMRLSRGIDEGRDRAELALARWALSKPLPLLAICRGIQVLNVATGGTLIQDIETQVAGSVEHSGSSGRSMGEIAHTVEVFEGTELAALFGAGELEVNSAHHQAVSDVGHGLVIAARAPDGVIEGLEKPDHPFCVGVQWHPEAIIEIRPMMRQLFEALVVAARCVSR